MELARSLGRLAAQLAGRGEPALEVTIVNLSSQEVRLPKARARVARGELRLAPAVFEALETLRPGSSGVLLFCGGSRSSTAGGGAAVGPAAAAELLVEGGEAEAAGWLRIGFAAGPSGRGHFATQWAAAVGAVGSLACFLEELPASAAHGALASSDTDDGAVRTDGFVAWVSRSFGNEREGGPPGAVTITLRSRDDPDLLGRPPRSGLCPHPGEGAPEQPPQRAEAPRGAGPPARPTPAPFLQRRKWLLITVVNYAGVGLTFPPDYAQLWAGEAWKEMTYLGPLHRGLLAFGDDLHFAGSAFCSLGGCRERLYFEASNPRVGPNTFSVHFGASEPDDSGCRSSSSTSTSTGGSGDTAPASGWGIQAAMEAFRGGFLGVPADATVSGEGFEALVTDARYGDGALATVAVYSRPASGAVLGARIESMPNQR